MLLQQQSQKLIEAKVQEMMAHLNTHLQTLGITQPVNFIVTDQVGSCRVASMPDGHDVYVPVRQVMDWQKIEPDLVHELCHLQLSERISSLLTHLPFHPDLQQQACFTQRAGQVKEAWDWVDIWVNTLRHRHWPRLSKEDIISLKDVLMKVPPQHYDADMLMVTVALTIVEARRFDVQGFNVRNRIRKHSREMWQTIQSLVEVYNQLPDLTYDADVDVPIMLMFTQRTAEILEFDFVPNLVEFEGALVWSW